MTAFFLYLAEHRQRFAGQGLKGPEASRRRVEGNGGEREGAIRRAVQEGQGKVRQRNGRL